MRLTQKWVCTLSEGSVTPLHQVLFNERSGVPTRGYRKGISDRKVPVPCSVRTHITRAELTALLAAADSRSVSLSRLLRALVTAFLRRERVQLPQARGPTSAALRELCRIGNNLNQVAHQANMLRLSHIERKARDCLAAVLAAVDRLG